ncbi:MAG: DUF86 domain-containing protein, partial [Gloeomargarita sp. SKYB31]|nr:DUF86 domain-containing protein [Gloeomargarita sp. SKYB31]
IRMAGEKAMAFIAEMDLTDFLQDDKTTFAVARALEIIGEATKSIPQAVRDRYPQIPWRAVAGMRDKLSHEYFRVDNRRLYYTVRQEVPQLMQTVHQILLELENGR